MHVRPLWGKPPLFCDLTPTQSLGYLCRHSCLLVPQYLALSRHSQELRQQAESWRLSELSCLYALLSHPLAGELCESVLLSVPGAPQRAGA